ncbi:MAG: SET domain-containing protein [Chloroflexota bacterium]
MNYRPVSWVHPHLELRPSRIDGFGVFATAPFREGETVFIWGGVLVTWDEYTAGRISSRSCSAVDEGLYLGKFPVLGDMLDDFANHSCDPNLWLVDSAALVARRDIACEEEVTFDYATFYDIDDWVVSENCCCGSPSCRGIVTGADWRLPALQERYDGHFAPFLARRIRLLANERLAR